MPLGKTLSDFILVEKRVSVPTRRRGGEESDGKVGDYKIHFLLVLTAGLFLWLVANLVRVQIWEGSYFRGLADNNRVAKIPIHAPRGIIFDRNDQPLVVNVPAFRLVDCSKGSKCSSRTVSKEQAISLEAVGLPKGQRLEVDSARSYPFGPALAHVLGYVSEVTEAEMKENSGYVLGDVTGRGGVEEEYQSRLAGKDGRELVEVDALGRKLRVLGTDAPVSGEDLHLTIDAAMQKTTYEEMKDKRGAVVVTNPMTGEIIALVSLPSFDPNVFTDPALLPQEQQTRVAAIFADSQQPLFDRAISGTYPAGSTFKIVTAAAGLQTGRIDENYTVEDTGIMIIGPYKFPNWLYLRNGGTQGTLNVVGALTKSNDIFFYHVGGLVGVDDLGVWAEKLGVNRKLGVDLPGEEGGIFPTASWREANTRSWYLGDTYHLAIGQGDLLVTPFQDNAWISVIANGGFLCRPHVLRDLSNLRDLCKPTGVSPKTIALIKQGLVGACSPGGTAWPLFDFRVKGKKIQVACKTGTAEFGDPAGRTHAWLTSFAPTDKPEIAVTVLVEGGGEGSDVAAPVVKKIMETWFSNR